VLNNIEGSIISSFEFNNRFIMTWKSVTCEGYMIGIFNKLEPINDFSKNFNTQWGYMTYFAPHISSFEELSDLYRLYITDIQNKNYWWESD